MCIMFLCVFMPLQRQTDTLKEKVFLLLIYHLNEKSLKKEKEPGTERESKIQGRQTQREAHKKVRGLFGGIIPCFGIPAVYI